MSPAKLSSVGVGLYCDMEGRILETLGDQAGIACQFPAGRQFSLCLDPGSLAKSLNFLEEIRTRQATFDWELDLAREDGVVQAFNFDGCIVDGRMLILGAISSQVLLSFLDDLMSVQNEQVNHFRLGLKEMSLKEAAAGRFQHDLFDELTRLNNDFANAQRELVKQNVELDRLNRLKTQFLGMAAHDLRSPIGHILMCSDFLCEEAAAVLSEEQLGFLDTIQTSSKFMLQLVDDFLDVSAIESGNLHLERRLSDPRRLLQQNVGLNAALALRKHIRVELQIEGVLPTLPLDEGKIAQVLNNLISNAIKFSKPGTAVTVLAEAKDGGLRIKVRDQGPGIPEAEVVKLFQPFGKTSVRSTGGEKSTGLGLAIARKIIEGHGGVIWVESKVGVGSTFLFTLPSEQRCQVE